MGSTPELERTRGFQTIDRREWDLGVSVIAVVALASKYIFLNNQPYRIGLYFLAALLYLQEHYMDVVMAKLRMQLLWV